MIKFEKICLCCGKLTDKVSRVDYKNSYLDEYICNDCMMVDKEEISLLVESIRASKNEFKKSLVKFYDEKGFLSQKQVQSIKLTRNEELIYYMNIKSFTDISTIINYLSEKKQLEAVKFLINNGNNGSVKAIKRVKRTCESLKVEKLINEYLNI